MTEKEETDEYGHLIAAGDYFLRGKYSRSTRFNKFSIIAGDALCAPEEVFDVFVDISDDLMLEKESFRALLSRAGAL